MLQPDEEVHKRLKGEQDDVWRRMEGGGVLR